MPEGGMCQTLDFAIQIRKQARQIAQIATLCRFFDLPRRLGSVRAATTRKQAGQGVRRRANYDAIG